eukprot:TRINITY_DN31025_c0_g1_i1.p1 TRINITY_DN31025_c0_g1~~TRINITY_DN31025_c0_g1_i1.p1  ORF type:complete len:546 (-),score=161.89 TRINITY_DN31025_c0_g1_i1:110-1672(-)
MGKAAAAKATAKGAKVKPSVMKGKTASVLLQRGKVDKDIVRKATTMTREEWLSHQKGMDEKWPLPDYMKGQKGHMAFKEETFAIVTRWTENTQIRYRPHAKAPGSKSHIRYEKYSKAKTVGEALRLSTYPADWCWDLERGFIKVVGGHVRDEPLNISKVDESKITAVDKAIHTWYKRELARKLGLPVTELAVYAGCNESLDDRASRLLAQKDAKEILEAAEKEGRIVTDDEVLRVLNRWSFSKNPHRRNVMKEGQDWVFSDTLGMLRDRQGDIHLTASTRKYPQVSELFARWLTDRLPEECKDFKFTSMNVNCNYAAQLHRDAGNFGPSFIRAFGDFKGGELNYWPEDSGAPTPLEKSGCTKATRQQFDLSKQLALFNGNCAHSVEEFQGERYSIVWFTLGCHEGIIEEDRAKLKQLGIPCPAADEDPYALLRAPNGMRAAKKAKADGAGKKSLPPFRRYTKDVLEKRKKTLGAAQIKKAAADYAKRRLKPENAKSFYSAEIRREKRAQKLQADAKKTKK